MNIEDYSVFWIAVYILLFIHSWHLSLKLKSAKKEIIYHEKDEIRASMSSNYQCKEIDRLNCEIEELTK